VVLRVLLILMIFLTGCSLFAKKSEVEIKSLTLTKVDAKGVGIDLVLAITNPNSYKLNLTGYRYELLVSSLLLSSAENHDTVEFPGNSVTDVRIPARVEYQDLMKILKTIPDPNQIPYQMKAGLNIRTPLGSYTVPVDKQGTFALPRNLLLERFLKQIK